MGDALPSPVTVVGGAGRTGSLVVRRLVDLGAAVRVVSRHASASARVPQGNVEVFDGDVRDGSGLDAALRGSRAVVFTIEPGSADDGPDSPRATMLDGVRHVVERAGPDLDRFVLVSQIYVTRRDHPMNRYGRLLDHRAEGEQLLRDSGLPYTVVRASWLTNDAGEMTGVRLDQGDTGDGHVRRPDLAEACVQALRCDDAVGTTFELYNHPDGPAASWPHMFAALERDQVAAA